MNIDWHDSNGPPQASLNMSEPLHEVRRTDEDMAQLGSKLTLLLPPFDENSDEYDYVELFGDQSTDED